MDCKHLQKQAHNAWNPIGTSTQTLAEGQPKMIKEVDSSKIEFDRSWEKQMAEVSSELEAAYRVEKGDLTLVFSNMLIYEQGEKSTATPSIYRLISCWLLECIY
jgi:hypothetical protein